MPNVTSKVFYEIRSIEQVLFKNYLEYVAFNKNDAYL